MSTKHQHGLQWIICGDTNDLKIDSILHISKSMKQVVSKPTRVDSVSGVEKTIDLIFTTMSNYFQEPDILPPLDNDPDKNGKPSDHKIVVMKPIDMVNNNPARTKREVTVRPLPESGLNKLGEWLRSTNWEKVNIAETAHEKAEAFEAEMLAICEETVPKKKIKKYLAMISPFMMTN